MKKINLLLALMLGCIVSYAATISGTVTNASNQPIPNLTVYIVDSTAAVPPNGFSATAITNANGEYVFTIPSNVPSGDWMEIYTNTCGMMYTQMHQYTGVNAIVNFTVCGGGVPSLYDTTSGNVYFIGANPTLYTPAYPAVVYLIERSLDSLTNSYILTLIDSTNTTANGSYQFVYSSNISNPLLVKAALTTANSNYATVLPTYYDSSLTWNNALFVNGQSTVNVFMISGSNPGGPGFIGGSVLQGANKTTAVGDPLNKRILILTDMTNHPIAYTYSDASGAFGFNNLAYGSYKIFGDAAGKTNPVLVVTISATQQSVSNVVFEENSTTFKGHIGTNSIDGLDFNNKFNVYPNPMSEQLTISKLDQIKGSKSIRLVSMNGAVVYHETTNNALISIPVQHLASGVYSLIINSEEGITVYKVSK